MTQKQIEAAAKWIAEPKDGKPRRDPGQGGLRLDLGARPREK